MSGDPGDSDADASTGNGGDETAPDGETESDGETEASLTALRREVEEKYDFENFGPSDMAEMRPEEWEAVFDPDSWIVGQELFDRVETDLRRRVAERDVFAAVERVREDGEERVVAYSDEGYAVVYPDGSVEGEGTVLRDVKATVALCSMDDYEVRAAPEDAGLPDPEEVPEGTGQLGNTMLQLVAAAQLLTGVGVIAIWLFTDLIPAGRGSVANIVPPTVGVFFVGIGLFLFTVVANARLSDRFRAEEYRERLRAVESGESRPDFLPPAIEDGDESEAP